MSGMEVIANAHHMQNKLDSYPISPSAEEED